MPLPGLPFCPVGEAVPSADRAALVALYEATGGANWTNSTNWLTEKPVAQWYGVLADDDGRVTGLYLGGNDLRGSIPRELGTLMALEALALQGNQLSGAIPAELGNLVSLRGLALGYNELSGPIPPELGELADLRGISLFYNRLSGPIPAELGGLANLEALHLAYNQLSGPIPPELGDIAGLRKLYLANNELSGPIPAELGGLESLLTLEPRGQRDRAGASPTGCGAWKAVTSESSASRSAGSGCSRSPFADRAALVALYEATDGANWHESTNWLSEPLRLGRSNHSRPSGTVSPSTTSGAWLNSGSRATG